MESLEKQRFGTFIIGKRTTLRTESDIYISYLIEKITDDKYRLTLYRKDGGFFLSEVTTGREVYFAITGDQQFNK